MIFRELRKLINRINFSADTKTRESPSLQIFQNFDRGPFGAPIDRCDDHHALVLTSKQNFVRDFRDGQCLERDMMMRTVRSADPSKEQPQIVIDFRVGADGRARVAVRPFLLNSDRRRKTFIRSTSGFSISSRN